MRSSKSPGYLATDIEYKTFVFTIFQLLFCSFSNRQPLITKSNSLTVSMGAFVSGSSSNEYAAPASIYYAQDGTHWSGSITNMAIWVPMTPKKKGKGG